MINTVAVSLKRDTKKLTKEGKIKDDASHGLSDIRREIKKKQAVVGKKLQYILKSAVDQGFVDSDTALTLPTSSMIPVNISIPGSDIAAYHYILAETLYIDAFQLK